MPEFIEFTRNYSDRSTGQGFQWEFYCERCGNGYRSKFQASATGLVTQALDTASSLLGGIFSRASDVSNRVQSATWERAHDKAFHEAAQEVRHLFVQCPSCNAWVCRERCWNEDRGLCMNCAPDVGVQVAAAQAETIAEQAVEKIRTRSYDVDEYVEGGDDKRAACAKCGAALKPGAKFCAECGTRVEEKRYCIDCGAEIANNAKFCPACGTKQE
ncbi:MAG: zinc ribbon domain-containing protein [Anaerolineae bacterium]|nr:zinc ribbon domain-containing protein [Anaerolineae bacterium]